MSQTKPNQTIVPLNPILDSNSVKYLFSFLLSLTKTETSTEQACLPNPSPCAMHSLIISGQLVGLGSVLVKKSVVVFSVFSELWEEKNTASIHAE